MNAYFDMDINYYVLERTNEHLITNLNNSEKTLQHLNDNSSDIHINDERNYKMPWKASVEVNSFNESKSDVFAKPSAYRGPLDYTEVQNFSNIPKQVENSSTGIMPKDTDISQKGRARLVRLQAVVDTASTEATSSASDRVESVDPVSRISSADSSSQSTSLPTKHWSVSTSDICGVSGNSIPDSYFSSTSEESAILTSPSNFDEISNTQEMQRYLTSDGQYVYGYKDSGGEFHFFYPSRNDRESHNEKERKRRSRVSDACDNLRKLVPGLSEKSDKASVFEQTAMYLKFLRDKYGTQYDQVYCEKYFLGRD